MECSMAGPGQIPTTMSTDTGVKDSISTTCSVSNMSISSVDVELDPDVRVICRDFIRGVCGRKKRCKFQHPTSELLDTLVTCNPEKKYAFCHDFQNKICERPSCKYIHCTSDEEQNYLKNNLLCLRYKCQYELGIYNIGLNSFKVPHESRKGSLNKFSPYTSENENESKRLRSHANSRADIFSNHNCRSASENDYGFLKNVTQHQLLEESKKIRNENEMLKERIAELQRRVHDLSTMNEMLLEQNAQYRQNSRNLQNTQNTATLQSLAMHSVPQNHMVVQNHIGGGSMYTPSQQGVVSMRVVNNSVMTPNVISQPTTVITTVPQSAPTSMQSPISSHTPNINSMSVPMNQMRPPPGLQTVTVQTDLSPSQRFNGNPNIPVQLIGGNIRVPVASVQSISVPSASIPQNSIQTITAPMSQTVSQSQNPQDIQQNQVAVVATYQTQGQRPSQSNQPPHITGTSAGASINLNGYQEIQRISVHHQQH